MALGGMVGGQHHGNAPTASEESSLPEILSGYCEGGEKDGGLGYLNKVLLHVQRTKKFEEVVGLMGPYLTNEDGTVSVPFLGIITNKHHPIIILIFRNARNDYFNLQPLTLPCISCTDSHQRSSFARRSLESTT